MSEVNGDHDAYGDGSGDDGADGVVERGEPSILAHLLGDELDAADEHDELDESDEQPESEGDQIDASEDDAAAFTRARQEILARTPEHHVQPSLERIQALVDLLGNPQRAYPVVHITGTNGKTTTARIVEALLREFGLRTGRFTSPHLHEMTERIAVDGEPISGAAFARAWEELRPLVELVDSRSQTSMSYFEVLVGLAYAVFADTPVDVAVVEVGMGGTWDATNVADGQVAVVTPVAIDHTGYLGSTVEEIAGEKAGIIKPGTVAVLAEQPVEAAEVLARRSVEVGARVVREGVDYGVLARSLAVGGQQLSLQGLGGTYEDLFLPLHGAHQAHNAATALTAAEAFFGGGQARARPRRGAGRVRRGDLTGTARGRTTVPDGARRRGAQPGRRPRDRGRRTRGVWLHPPGRARGRLCRQGRRGHPRGVRAGDDRAGRHRDGLAAGHGARGARRHRRRHLRGRPGHRRSSARRGARGGTAPG